MARRLTRDGEWAFFEGFVQGSGAPTGARLWVIALFRNGFSGSLGPVPRGATWRRICRRSSVYRRSRRWTLAGFWQDIPDAVNHAGQASGDRQRRDQATDPPCVSRTRGTVRLARVDGAVAIWPSLACRKPKAATPACPMSFTSTFARPSCGRFWPRRKPHQN